MNNLTNNTTETLIESYIEELETTSIATINTYTNSINQYVRFIEENNLDGTSPEAVKNYKKYLIENYKTGTVNAYLMSVKRFYAYLEDKGVCKNIAKNVKKVRETIGFKKDALTVEQCRCILTSMDTTTLTGSRNKALFSLMVHTGLRTIEINRAVVGDIRNNGNNVVLFVQGKGHNEKNEYVVLCESVQEDLNVYFKMRTNVNGNSPLFECTGNRATGTALNTKSISRIIKGIYKENGLVSERLTAHSTRHTACTLSLLAGATLQETKAMARHQNINTTMIYAHNLNRSINNAESKIASLLD